MRTSLLRRLATVATALGLTSAGFLGAGAAPAQAAISDCPSGYFCAWKTDNGTGTMYKTNTNVATLGTWDNTFRSVVNRTSQFVCMYDETNYGGTGWSREPDPAGTEWGGPGSNSVSSVKFVRTERECNYPAYPAWYAATAPQAAGFGDLNADKRADVLVRDKAGRLWFLPGDQTGQLVGTGGWNAFNALIRHGDFSGDGREDVIAREAATGKLWLYPGTGTGSLGARVLIGTGGWNAMSRMAAFGDLSGDGRSDVLAVEQSTGKLWLYPGTTTGGLGARTLLGSGGWNGMNALVGAGDMNTDGRADLIAREPSTGKLWLYPGKAGYLGPRVLIGSGGWNTMETFLGVGDFTGDGHFDLATVSKADYVNEACRGVGCLVTYPGTGTGALGTGEPVNTEWHGLNGAF
ncbi:VCBS repeat-containing protein [Streptomyces sp. ISL-36]|uniref:FG-GAP-like repeat-containing protein n=1 Tax=Streptomyces sp. ISL-36 TaxID=2819182 RepID=UPI001BE784D7|nr:FG-GAP-like repeat-containing protein [Streptomyces sp. ISL-36]MBT2440873.1 VCBS repeat-containing protein [Streptomyces sp. ISL-36]